MALLVTVPSVFEKSTWKEFLEHDEFQYLGSSFSFDFNGAIEPIKRTVENNEYNVNRELVKKTGTVLHFKTSESSISILDKRGRVFKYSNCFIIYTETKKHDGSLDYSNGIVYRYK